MIERLKRRWSGPGGYAQVIHIAFPLILSSATWSIQHFVDRMFLAWYSPEAIAASSPAGFLNFTLSSLFIGTAGFVSVFAAQYYGAGRFHRIGPALWQSLYFSVFGGIFLICLIPFAPPFFKWVGHDVQVQALEVQYFSILCIGGIPAIASSAFSGFLTGLGRTWPVLWVNLIATIVNLVLDYTMIFGNWGFKEMGMGGAAMASVISVFISALMLGGFIFSAENNRIYHVLKGFGVEKALFFRLIRFGLPAGVQFFLDMAGFTVFILLVGRLGAVSLAATNIAFNINMLAFLPMTGAGMAVSVLVGRYLGKEDVGAARFSVYSGFHLTFVYMGTVAAAYVLIPDVFVAPFAVQARDPENFREIYRTTVVLLRFVAAYSIFDTMNIIFASAIRGAGDTKFIMFMLLGLSFFCLVLPTYVAIETLGMGLMTAWVIATAYVVILGLSFYARFRGGKWQTLRVIEKRI